MNPTFLLVGNSEKSGLRARPGFSRAAVLLGLQEGQQQLFSMREKFLNDACFVAAENWVFVAQAWRGSRPTGPHSSYERWVSNAR